MWSGAELPFEGEKSNGNGKISSLFPNSFLLVTPSPFPIASYVLFSKHKFKNERLLLKESRNDKEQNDSYPSTGTTWVLNLKKKKNTVTLTTPPITAQPTNLSGATG